MRASTTAEQTETRVLWVGEWKGFFFSNIVFLANIGSIEWIIHQEIFGVKSCNIYQNNLSYWHVGDSLEKTKLELPKIGWENKEEFIILGET